MSSNDLNTKETVYDEFYNQIVKFVEISTLRESPKYRMISSFSENNNQYQSFQISVKQWRVSKITNK